MGDYRSVSKIISDLSLAERQAMTDLYLRYYDGSCQERFNADLAAKTESLLVYSGASLVGFSALELYERSFGGQRVRIIYSGDTVVDRAHWGQQTLAFSWITRLRQLRDAAPDVPMYWFLIVKGHRTFKYLPAFAKSFYPHWEDNRSDLKPLLDYLADEKFGADYKPESGLVEYACSHGHLKAEIAEPSQEELAKPAVALFLVRNPRFREGHELCCLCEITELNMRPLTLRLFQKSLP